ACHAKRTIVLLRPSCKKEYREHTATEELLPRRITAPSFPPHGSGAAAVFTPSSAYLHPIFRQVRSTHRTVTHVGTKQGRGPRAVEMVRHLCPGDRSSALVSCNSTPAP